MEINDLIKEAKYLSLKTGVIYCIFDSLESTDGIERKRFYVDSWLHILYMPSRTTLYDTETDHTDHFERHKVISKFMESIGFRLQGPPGFGQGSEEFDSDLYLWDNHNMEISYRSDIYENIGFRVKPNFLIEFIVVEFPTLNEFPRVNSSMLFYDKNRILNCIFDNSTIEEKRNLKINTIINE